MTSSSYTELPPDQLLPLAGAPPREGEHGSIKHCTRMSTAAPFTTAQTWKQSKCPSTGEWIKMWPMYTVEYPSDTEENKVRPFVVTRVELESLIRNEVSQRERERQIPYDISYMESKLCQNAPIYRTKNKHRDMEKRHVVANG